MRWLFVAMMFLAWPGNVAAQTAGTNLRTEAVRLRNSGHFAEAVSALRAHLAQYPDDGDATRLLAETLYWMKDFAGSNEVSEHGLSFHPGDNSLRVQYARRLAETGRFARAQEVLAPATASGNAAGPASALRDTIDSWRAAAAGRWVKLAPRFRHDDQPLNRTELAAEAGFYPAANVRTMLRVDATHFSLEDSASRSAQTFEAAAGYSAMDSPLSFEGTVGMVQRSFGGASLDIIGSAEVGARFNSNVRLRGRGQRAPYFYTEASLSQTVMTTSGAIFLDLGETRGWQGQGVYQVQQYPDNNKSTTAYVWLLAPLFHASEIILQAGYSGAAQNSDETRFVLASQTIPGVISDFSGRYTPYYTPINMVSHSLLAAFRFQGASTGIFSANASYGVRASEDFTSFSAGTGTQRNTVVRSVGNRSFTPWNGRVSFALPRSRNFETMFGAEVEHGAFYTTSGAAASLTWKF